jgi:hypothetical protein
VTGVQTCALPISPGIGASRIKQGHDLQRHLSETAAKLGRPTDLVELPNARHQELQIVRVLLKDAALLKVFVDAVAAAFGVPGLAFARDGLVAWGGFVCH